MIHDVSASSSPIRAVKKPDFAFAPRNGTVVTTRYPSYISLNTSATPVSPISSFRKKFSTAR